MRSRGESGGRRISTVEGTKDEPYLQIPNPNQYHLPGLHQGGDVMREKSASLPSFRFPRSHLDSDTYRSFARIITHFLDHTANTNSQPPPPPPPPASGLDGTTATGKGTTVGAAAATGQDVGHSNESLRMDDELLNMDVFDNLSLNNNVDREQLLAIQKDFSDCISPQVQQQQQQKHENDARPSGVEELEDGEILNELGDGVRLSYLGCCHVGEIGDRKDKDKLIEEIVDRRDNFDRESDETLDNRDYLDCVRGQAVVKSYELNCGQGSFTCKEDNIIGHDFTRKTDSRNSNPIIVDYSDLYCSDPATYKVNTSHHTSKGGESRSTRKKDIGDKPLGHPSNDKGRKTKDDDSHVSIPADSSLHRSISLKEPIPNLDKESNNMIDEIVEMKKKKKKNGPLTEERKAKKKRAKKRKRAEQNRKLGIKRLKIVPIIKPKKVVYCDFYLKGKCQKGNLCTFSHDTIPLTKSQPCKYFVSESCLKGVDCPFDHDLSKYPCHNFMSSGTCSRGETCKFSHKISEADAKNFFVTKPDSLWLSEKQLSSTSLVDALDNSPAKVALHTSSSLHKHLGEQQAGKSMMKVSEGKNFVSSGSNLSGEENSEKNQCSEKQFVNRKTSNLNNDEPVKTTSSILNTVTQQAEQLTSKARVKVPRGIQFLSFDKYVAEEAKKSKDELSKRSNGINIQKHQDKTSTIPQNVSEVSLCSAGLFPSSLQNNKLSVDAQNPNVKWAKELHSRETNTSTTRAEKLTDLVISPTCPKEFNRSSKLVETSKSINNDVTDASKILEEFLFCGSTT